jgi:hypothetical protein
MGVIPSPFAGLVIPRSRRKVSSLSFAGQTQGTTTTISLPGTEQVGDLAIVIYAAVASSGTPTPVTPSGFTPFAEALGGSRAGLWLYYKVLGAGDLGATYTGASGSTGTRWKTALFRGDARISSVTAGSPNGQATTGNPSNQTITSSDGTPPLVVIGAAQGQVGVSLSGTLNSAGTELQTSGSTQRAVYLIANSAAPNYTWGMADAGDYNALVSAYLSVS